METVVSGIRPTGQLHLGNYFGAVKNFLRMQKEYNCYFFIADYHSLTTVITSYSIHYTKLYEAKVHPYKMDRTDGS